MSAPVRSTRVSTLGSEKKTIVGSVNLKLSGDKTKAHTTLPLGTAGISRKGSKRPSKNCVSIFPTRLLHRPCRRAVVITVVVLSSRSKNQNITG